MVTIIVILFLEEIYLMPRLPNSYTRLGTMCNLICIEDIESETIMNPARSIDFASPMCIIDGTGYYFEQNYGFQYAQGGWYYDGISSEDWIPQPEYGYRIGGRGVLILPFREKMCFILGHEQNRTASADWYLYIYEDIDTSVEIWRHTSYAEVWSKSFFFTGAINIRNINIGWSSYLPMRTREIDIFTAQSLDTSYIHGDTNYIYPHSEHKVGIKANILAMEVDVVHNFGETFCSDLILKGRKKIFPPLTLGLQVEINWWKEKQGGIYLGVGYRTIGIAFSPSPNTILGLDLEFLGLTDLTTIIIGGEKRINKLVVRGGLEFRTEYLWFGDIIVGFGYPLAKKIYIDCGVGSGIGGSYDTKIGVKWQF